MKKGFTLIELLVVIAILSVLAVAVTLILNPAELIKQGRDSTRLSDMAALNSAIALYLADVKNPGIGGANNAACSTATARITKNGTSPFTATATVNSSTTIDGTGWVLVDFEEISSGSPLSRLPLDPVNDTTNFYGYACNGTSYELNANMESAKFSTNGGSDVESNTKDGGNNNNWYEIGNDPGLDL